MNEPRKAQFQLHRITATPRRGKPLVVFRATVAEAAQAVALLTRKQGTHVQVHVVDWPYMKKEKLCMFLTEFLRNPDAVFGDAEFTIVAPATGEIPTSAMRGLGGEWLA
jgi:hypothetical protein